MTDTAVLGRVVTPFAVLDPGAVIVRGDHIVAVEPVAALELSGLDVLEAPEGGYILPGLVDVHNHGGGGASFPDAVTRQEAMTAVLQHRRHGTTTLVASLVTAPAHVLLARTRTLTELCEMDEIAGLHYEGPFLSAIRCGAQNSAALMAPDADLVAELLGLARGHVVAMTCAPELPGTTDVVAALVAGGALPSFGHTDASASTTRDALAASFSALATTNGQVPSFRPTVTHLFNGMRPLHHRDPGPILEMLAAARRGHAVLELIGDGAHLDPFLVRSVYEMVGRDHIVLITDAIAAAGMPDGDYLLGGLAVSLVGGVANLTGSDAIAGGTAHLIDVVRVTVAGGVSVVDAVYMAATSPAHVLGRTDVGALMAGRRADLILTDAELHVRQVLRAGIPVSPV